jgi:hypothetical protein
MLLATEVVAREGKTEEVADKTGAFKQQMPLVVKGPKAPTLLQLQLV